MSICTLLHNQSLELFHPANLKLCTRKQLSVSPTPPQPLARVVCNYLKLFSLLLICTFQTSHNEHLLFLQLNFKNSRTFCAALYSRFHFTGRDLGRSWGGSTGRTQANRAHSTLPSPPWAPAAPTKEAGRPGLFLSSLPSGGQGPSSCSRTSSNH